MRPCYSMIGWSIALIISPMLAEALDSDNGPSPTTQMTDLEILTKDEPGMDFVHLDPDHLPNFIFDTNISGICETALNAPSPLSIPTYDGKDQCVHPDVLFFPDGWNGYIYWMAMTPYPNGNDKYENPCIVASNDNVNWVEPVVNPLDTRPNGTHNSDTELVYLEDSDSFQLTYRRGEWELYSKWSSDGRNWSRERNLSFSGRKWNCCLSPSIVVEDDGNMSIWMVNGVGYPNTLMLYGQKKEGKGTWTYRDNCTIVNMPPGKDIWHVDVTRHPTMDLYLGLMTLSDKNSTCNTTLYLGISVDGLEWWLRPGDLLPSSASGWDNEMIYRSSGLVQRSSPDHTLRIWYSARSTKGKWRIGYTESKLNISALLLARAKISSGSSGSWFQSITNSTMIWTSEPEPAPIGSPNGSLPGVVPSVIDTLPMQDNAYRLDVGNEFPGKTSLTRCNISSLRGDNLSWGSLVIIDLEPQGGSQGATISLTENHKYPVKVDHGRYVLVKDENNEGDPDDRSSIDGEAGGKGKMNFIIWMLPLVVSLMTLMFAAAGEIHRPGKHTGADRLREFISGAISRSSRDRSGP
ncbi:MAG: hypothetical protein ACMUHB_00190 [Thermoplasmatota archaeon]